MARDYSSYSKEALIIHIQELEKQLKNNKYGLYWDKSIAQEEVVNKCKTDIPVIKREYDLCMLDNPDADTHILIEGDNFHALTAMNMMCGNEGFVDVIYIDPPYNTGNKDFVYNDSFVNEDDGYRHSKWLSFMESRLSLAKRLMRDDAAIFISIDDNEEAQLKLLCDSVFGGSNFMGMMIQNKQNAKNDTTDIQKNHEYILAYRKKAITNGSNIKATLVCKNQKLRPAVKENSRYFYIGDAITTRGEGGTLNARPNLGYTVYYNESTGHKIAIADYDIEMAKTSNDASIIYNHQQNLIEEGYEAIIPPKVRGKLGCWTWGLEKFNEENDNIIITGKKGKRAVKKRTFVPEESIEEIDGNLFYHSIDNGNSRSILDFSTNDGTNVLKDIMGETGTFNNPKNLEMIKYLISLKDKKDAVILDFFVGSGTTGQAVLELNKEDGGHRTFIICTNNENNICAGVTYPRLKTVITGKRTDGTEYSEGIPANLMYYKTDFIKDSNNTDQAKYCLVEKVDELLCIVEDTFIFKKRTDQYSVYQSLDGSRSTFIYSDYYSEEPFKEYLKEIEEADGEKVAYVFSTDNIVDEALFAELPEVTVKSIPSKIYEIYKEIVEDIKRGEQ